MANRERGEKRVMVGGKEYTLRPTFDSLCELEELVGKPLHELLPGIEQGRISGLRAVVWCFLQDEHADEFKTLKAASAWIEELGGADQARDLVDQIIALNATPEGEMDGTPRPPEAQTSGTGVPLSSAPATSD